RTFVFLRPLGLRLYTKMHRIRLKLSVSSLTFNISTSIRSFYIQIKLEFKGIILKQTHQKLLTPQITDPIETYTTNKTLTFEFRLHTHQILINGPLTIPLTLLQTKK
ncbi:hypothetical protein PTB13_02420, partial [Bacillus sp. MHSD17]|nr:hypothetical protein [Bacillus sp. MHSD17]